MRIGHGYDVHKFAENRKLILGGVEIPYELGLLGHSDADVLVHAVMDSLLGAAALGDIGKQFPDTDEKYKGADSMALLREVCRILAENGYKIGNIDSTVIAQKPKLKDYILSMRENIASACNIDISQVSVKATTEENLGFTGRLEGISAHAVCIIE
ncbi:2-C-methyl-D-erythritol 2,4-cyclodiphosphate synthase [Ruminococcus sp.]|uniref:2-C-methyl-D-erythritol 2,4-cyclodiphosphate synthase n=1 Tax=Ruminococcus sp. TaxID=41978 RepID=UPI00386A1DF1